MNIAFIGKGAMAQYAALQLIARGHRVSAFVLRPDARLPDCLEQQAIETVTRVADLPEDIDCLVDCAGHQALATHGIEAICAGTDVITVSLGALADREVERQLKDAIRAGGGRLTVVAGAIGGLDALRAARVGSLTCVRYIGRKPPKGWKGSRAEEVLDLANPGDGPARHFIGTAREAASLYPKNANVAAAVALAGIGFDDTEAELIADPTVETNIHEIVAEGDFGTFEFRISGQQLPDNPKTSALAAMSVISAVEENTNLIRF